VLFRFGSAFASKVVAFGNEMAYTAAHLNAEIILAVTVKRWV